MHYKLMRDKLNLLLAIMVLLAVPFSAARSLAAPGLPKTKPTRALPQNAAPNRLTPAASLAMVQDERDRYWLHAKQEVYKSVLELLAQNEDELQHGMRASKFMHGDTGRKWIALTFDDGPHPAYTPKLLQILSRYNAKATFFVVGEMAEKYPGLVRAEIADGHSVGNHTYDHVSLIKIPDTYVPTEIKACGSVLRHITGRAPHLFRPPGGEYDEQVAEAAAALGYKMVLWTDDPGDYASPGQQVIIDRTLSRVRNGGIILLHDGIQQTLDILPGLLQRLQGEGYEFVTIDDMLKAQTARLDRRPPASIMQNV